MSRTFLLLAMLVAAAVVQRRATEASEAVPRRAPVGNVAGQPRAAAQRPLANAPSPR